jgi:hypothetical protein
LANDLPEGFYRPVARILLAIAASNPGFFVAYHCLLLEALPIKFVQFRNIILNVPTSGCEEIPPMGFKCESLLKGTGVHSLVREGDYSATKVRRIFNVLSRILFVSQPMVPRLIWEFVIHCLNQRTEKIDDLFVQICNGFTDASVRMLIVSLIDQLRFHNAHTVEASRILTSVFAKGNGIVRELVLVEVMRRMLCVTLPPVSLFKFREKLDSLYGNEIAGLMKSKDQHEKYKRSLDIANCLGLPRSPSGPVAKFG